MGVWGGGLYSNDTAGDLRDIIRVVKRMPRSGDELLQILLRPEIYLTDIGHGRVEAPERGDVDRAAAAHRDTQQLPAEHDAVACAAFILLERADGERIDGDILCRTEAIIENDQPDQQLIIGDKSYHAQSRWGDRHHRRADDDPGFPTTDSRQLHDVDQRCPNPQGRRMAAENAPICAMDRPSRRMNVTIAVAENPNGITSEI